MEVDSLRLIKEVKQRPLLWLKKPKTKMIMLWTEIGKILNADASLCKRTWQVMRIRFWVEKKRIFIRIAKAKRQGTYNPRKKYTSWDLFNSLRFLDNVQSAHRKYNSIEDVEIVRRKNSKKNCIENVSNESGETGKDNPIEGVLNLNSAERELPTISNEGAGYPINPFVKQDPELQIETEIKPTANENMNVLQENKSSILSPSEFSHSFVGTDFCQISIKPECMDQSTPTEKHYTSDEDYSFLYSFLSQTKQMSQSQKLEFHAKMKSLLLAILPASASLNILENQLLLTVDDDADKRFLISFWPFLKSMSIPQNLEFRSEMADLVLSFYSTKNKLNLFR